MVVDWVIIGMADTMMLLIGYDGHTTDAVFLINWLYQLYVHCKVPPSGTAGVIFSPMDADQSQISEIS